jgi:hypothetical protein
MAAPGKLLARVRLGFGALGAGGQAPRAVTHRRPDQPARPVRLPAIVGASPEVIRKRVGRMLVFFVCDDSGSMYGSWGDPTGVRYAAALSLLRLMVRSGGGRAAVVHWGTESPPELALAPMPVKGGRRALKRNLVVPPTLGGNDLPLALRRALEMTPDLADDERVVYFVLTDGIEAVTSATHAAVEALAEDSVHMILVDRSNGCTPEMESTWKTVPFGSFTRLRSFETKPMARQLAETFAAAIDLELPEV